MVKGEGDLLPKEGLTVPTWCNSQLGFASIVWNLEKKEKGVPCVTYVPYVPYVIINKNTKVNVLHWVCCIEECESNGQHFHLALKSSKNKRWLPVKRKMKNNHNVALHFFDSHITYFTAWCNDTKSDKSYLQRVWNPDLKDATVPQISNAWQVRCRKRKTKNTVFVNINKKEKLTNKIVSEITSYKNIKNKTELYAIVQAQKRWLIYISDK